MRYFSVSNLHCIKETGQIPLRAINIFVGANSTGKSSVLRVFPLIRQSLVYNKKGLLLWYGDWVDFGSYAEAHRNNSGDMSFSMGLNMDLNNFGYKKNASLTECDLEYSISSKLKTDYLQRFRVAFLGYSIEMFFTSGGRVKRFVVNGTDYSSIVRHMLALDAVRMIPQIRYVNSTKREKGSSLFFVEESLVLTKLLPKSALNQNIPLQDITSLISSIGIDSPEKMLMKMRESEKKYMWVSKWTTDDKSFRTFIDFYFIYHLESFLMRLDYWANEIFSNFYYLGPYRAAVERYYRIQNVAVREIDPHGENLAMYLGNLSVDDRASLQKWMKDKFGFFITTETSKGHLSMVLVDEFDNEKYNLIDKGFGFSQLMPIIVMLWRIEFRQDYSLPVFKSRLFAIEQPELHLHPKLMVLLADTFVSCVNAMREAGIELQLVLETHSPTLINRLGELVYEKKIDKEDIAITIFNDVKNAPELKQVDFSHFNAEGVLDNWPVGFFDV